MGVFLRQQASWQGKLMNPHYEADAIRTGETDRPRFDIASYAAEASRRERDSVNAAAFAVACSELAEALGLCEQAQLACLFIDAIQYDDGESERAVPAEAVSARLGFPVSGYKQTVLEIASLVTDPRYLPKEDPGSSFLRRYISVRH
ncbi:hypothetical protein U8335_04320 [Roseiconus lacunae]|uniref:hypothetical protein n=1 Tax=Roseiconus lacunae TaxID=2605694 RepID=UPI003090B8BD|nr:hypothetical protein U8335_04320 [Stieleria sp. HD01]